jgi:dinuclear metal center YbgI/SA1388 family protein
MRLDALIPRLQTLAPESLAESWDKVGLHVGRGAWPVKRGLLCIDLTAAVVREAVEKEATLIVAYHPLLFEPVNRLTEADAKQAILLELVQRRIAVYCPHTALDAVAGGVNDWLAQGVIRAAGGREGTRCLAIKPAHASSDTQPRKLVTFVPGEHFEELFTALCEAGAGTIGAYDACSFTVDGQGTFRGGPGTNPTIGRPGNLERVAEKRLEMVVRADRVEAVIAALRKAHPYEEPAFDLLRIEPPAGVHGLTKEQREPAVGQGRIVELAKAVSVRSLLAGVKKHLGVASLEVALPAGLSRVRRVGLCAGAGGSLLKDAGNIELFITGEMRHHDVLAALSRGVGVVLAGHTQTERPYLQVYRQRIEAAVGAGVRWLVSRADCAPSQRY